MQDKKTMQYKKTKYFNIYGARKSKDGKRLNITIVSGSNDEREFATISLDLEKLDYFEEWKNCFEVKISLKKLESKQS